jgi:hypothetical protein
MVRAGLPGGRRGDAPSGRLRVPVRDGLASGEREAGGDVQQPVAQPFGFGAGQFAVERQGLGPDEQVVGEHHDLDPHLVERELLERQLGQAGVLVVTDAVLDPGALAVTTLQDCDVRVGLIGQDRLEAVPSWSVNESCAPGCGRSRRTITREPAGQEPGSTRSVSSTTCPLQRADPSWSSAAIHPAPVGGEDR